MLKKFNGLCSFLSEFCYMSSEVLRRVRKLAEGPNKTPIDWTKQNIADFLKVKEMMQKMTVLHPINPDLETIMVTDTSKYATGSILYQKDKDENGTPKKRIIGLFSKKRSDLDNKNPIPSCVLELSGIAAAACHFRPYLERLNHKLIIYTDSLGAERAYKKFQIDCF